MNYCYTDGSCKISEKSPGGWGVYIKKENGEVFEKSGSSIKTNSKIMEYTAILEAVIALPESSTATVFSDSQSAIETCNKWLKIWQENGFKNVDSEILELVQKINAEINSKNLKITWQWIKSHNGNAGNERADFLATEAARKAKDKIKKDSAK